MEALAAQRAVGRRQPSTERLDAPGVGGARWSRGATTGRGGRRTRRPRAGGRSEPAGATGSARFRASVPLRRSRPRRWVGSAGPGVDGLRPPPSASLGPAVREVSTASDRPVHGSGRDPHRRRHPRGPPGAGRDTVDLGSRIRGAPLCVVAAAAPTGSRRLPAVGLASRSTCASWRRWTAGECDVGYIRARLRLVSAEAGGRQTLITSGYRSHWAFRQTCIATRMTHC